MSSDEFILSREQVLGGLPSRQASMVLFAIESRTAYLMQRSRMAASRMYVEKSSEEDERTFLGALAQGRKATATTIQNLEQYAPDWADLVPYENAAICAALARLLKEKYRFARRHVPGIRAALGLERDSLQQLYQQYHAEPLESIYVTRVAGSEQIRWRWTRLASWLEHLSPFWTAFALTITETIGASILAIPMAIARLGVIPGLILLIALGLTSTLTVMALVEAITRNGNMRYGDAYLGQLVDDYLGRSGTLLLTISFFVLILLILGAFAIGIANTLYDVTGIPAPLWTVVIFLVYVYFLRQKSLHATVASAMAISGVNTAILLLLMALSVPHIRMENLLYSNIPFLNGGAFDSGVIELIFGVILTGYFGHTSAANAAKVVLRRDPSGHSLMWGNIAAFAVVIIVTCLWVIAIGGAVAPEILAETSGTVIAPLSTVVGPIVLILGTIFVILGMGMTGVHMSLALTNQLREWFSFRRKAVARPQSLAPGHSAVPRRALSAETAQFLISVLPLAAIFGIVGWLQVTGQESFTGVIGIVGVVAVPIIAGIIPILVLAASRRKGEYVPEIVFRWLDNPILLGAVYLFYLVGILLHGVVIWQEWIPRIVALSTGLLVCTVTVIAIRHGLFKRRTILEVRSDQDRDETTYQCTTSGQLLTVEMTFNFEHYQLSAKASGGAVPKATKLHSLVFHLPPLSTPTLKIWAHKITREDYSVSLPVLATIQNGEHREEYHLQESNGQLLVSMRNNSAHEVTIDFACDESHSERMLSDKL